MKTWQIHSGGDDLKIGTHLEIFNWGEYPGVSATNSKPGDKVTVNFYSHSGYSGVISNATNQTITLALEKVGEIKLKLNSGTRLIDTKSELKHTEWIVV